MGSIVVIIIVIVVVIVVVIVPAIMSSVFLMLVVRTVVTVVAVIAVVFVHPIFVFVNVVVERFVAVGIRTDTDFKQDLLPALTAVAVVVYEDVFQVSA